jgi:tetratricopeptide (TPR) repeat protein
VLSTASYATRDEMSRGDLLPASSLAGQLQRDFLADRALMDQILHDWDDQIQADATSLERAGTGSWQKAQLLALLERPEEAEAELLRGLAMQEALGIKTWQGNLTEMLARIYRQKGQLDRAEATLRRAAELHEAVQKWPEAAMVWDSLGRLLRERQRPQEAVAVARHAVEVARKPALVKFHLAASLSGLGRALWDAGQGREAATFFAEAARLEAPGMSQVGLQARALRSAGDPQAVELMREVCRRQLAREEWEELPSNALSLARWEGPSGLPHLERVARELVRFRQEAPTLRDEDRELLEELAERLIRAGRPQEAAGWLEARALLERPVTGLETTQGELARCASSSRRRTPGPCASAFRRSGSASSPSWRGSARATRSTSAWHASGPRTWLPSRRSCLSTRSSCSSLRPPMGCPCWGWRESGACSTLLPCRARSWRRPCASS